MLLLFSVIYFSFQVSIPLSSLPKSMSQTFSRLALRWTTRETPRDVADVARNHWHEWQLPQGSDCSKVQLPALLKVQSVPTCIKNRANYHDINTMSSTQLFETCSSISWSLLWRPWSPHQSHLSTIGFPTKVPIQSSLRIQWLAPSLHNWLSNWGFGPKICCCKDVFSPFNVVIWAHAGNSHSWHFVEREANSMMWSANWLTIDALIVFMLFFIQWWVPSSRNPMQGSEAKKTSC